MDHVTSLTRYDAACRALTEARSVDEVKDIRDTIDAIRWYARQASNKQLEVDAAEMRLRAERRLGEMLREQKETVGMATGGQPYQSTGSSTEPVGIPTLADVGIDKKLSSRAQKLAEPSDDALDVALDKWREYSMALDAPVSLKMLYNFAEGRMPHVARATGEFEWYSPPEIIEAARSVCGDFDLDPASCEMAQENVKAKAYYTEADDGLSLDWYGRVWMNPPYAAGVIEFWTRKLLENLASGSVTQAFVLVNNATETVWFQEMLDKLDAICFPKGRLRFGHPEGKVSTPLQGQAVIYFGQQTEAFQAAFAKFSRVFR